MMLKITTWTACRAALFLFFAGVIILPAQTPVPPSASAPAPVAQTAPAAPVNNPVTISAPANYELTQGDIIGVKVFREPDLDSQLRISKEGTVKFPLIGVVKIVGMSADQAAARIANLLDPDYLIKPQITVSVMSYAKQRFQILGQVSAPGSYSIPDEQALDILNAIAIAGGFTRLAKPNAVTVTRFTDGKKQTFQINVEKLMKEGNGERFIIQPNDVINVTERIF